MADAIAAHAVVPNMPDYEQACREFSWAEARRQLDGLPGGRGLNIAHECVDRHVTAGHGGKTALVSLAQAGRRRVITFAALKRDSNRFANVLVGLGIQPGDRVFAIAGRIPELIVAALGTLKARGVFAPLFSAFGPEPLAARIAIGRPRVIVTTQTLHRQKLAAILADCPSVEQVIVIRDEEPPLPPGVVSYEAAVGAASSAFQIGPTSPDAPALLHFTSGTTGTPKGALHVHEAVVAHHATGRLALDLHPDDVFWCTADPGWVTGTSYGIVAPLACGVTSVLDEGDFDAVRWYRILAAEGVSVWYTAPTAIRMMMRLGAEAARQFDTSRLRFLASVGEPLAAEAVAWGSKAFGLPFHDNWWQTETGGIMIANYLSQEIRPGSMGRPLPGIEAAVVERTPAGRVRELPPGEQGEIALRPGWPSMFREYCGAPDRYRACFADGWYLTGDLARRDEDGYFWFVGRKDDVIKTSGHLVGPFEVESVLLEHEAVAEAGVIGTPDPAAYEIVKAFIALKPGFTGDDALRRSILGHARKRLGAVVAPKEIAFVADLPRTRSGKIMRRLLKARALGLPEGDLSALETPAPTAGPRS
ncbi:MAG: acetate--CoA ligase [Planctomycetaceae bacterium]